VGPQTCCGMPKLEHGDIASVATAAKATAEHLEPYVDQGYTVVALVPSCSLMLKSEWPLLLPHDASVRRLADASKDISEYLINLDKQFGTPPGRSNPGVSRVAVHMSCHSRALNVGNKGAHLVDLVPDVSLNVVDKCSGHGTGSLSALSRRPLLLSSRLAKHFGSPRSHVWDAGGSWGCRSQHFETAKAVGKPALKALSRHKRKPTPCDALCSECPLAGAHLMQMWEELDNGTRPERPAMHPVQLFAASYGLVSLDKSS